MKFKESDLLFEDKYRWKRDSGDRRYIGKLDRIKLDRDEGYEVLDFANTYLYQNVRNASKKDLHKLEMMLREKLPSNVDMKDEIADFLLKNW